MSDTSKTVFISYRRDVSWAHARLIYQDLRDHGFDVFMDVESIDSGEFGKIILRQILAREHFIVILAPGATRRFADSGDWLRAEIEFALKTERNIVPIFTSGFRFQDFAADFTGDLEQLVRFNGLNLVTEYFEPAMLRLRGYFLIQSSYGDVQPPPEDTVSDVEERVERLDSQPPPTHAELDAANLLAKGNLKLNVDKDYSGATEDYSKAILLKSDFVEAYKMRGLAHALKLDFTASVSDFLEVISMVPQYSDGYRFLGMAYIGLGNYENATEQLSLAIRIDPNDPQSYCERGIAHSRKGDYGAAFADYTRAIELEPEHHIAYYLRGQAYFATYQVPSARKDFEHSYEIEATQGNRAGLAITHHSLGNMYDARKIWRELIIQDKRFRDPDWVKQELNWAEPLVEEARKLIAGLDA